MAKKTKKRTRGGASFLCPMCQSPSQVIITRRDEDSKVRRVRRCVMKACSNRFQTVESEDRR